MKVENIFKSISEKLKLDFQHLSSEIQHRPSKGRVREVELAEQFLGKYIPKPIGIAHGEIVATSGKTSSECDILFYETRSCPYLLNKTGYQIFPIECVYGVLEVKSNLNTAELTDCFNKISKIKKFSKTAYEPQRGAVLNFSRLYGKKWDFFPTIGFVFAYASIDLVKLQKTLHELQKKYTSA